MKHLLITGMGRSGTTLLDKLLTNHKEIDVLSQPLPLLFVEVKKQFLKSKGIDKYYALNDDSISRGYLTCDLDNFLANFSITHAEIERIFHSMRDYSGQYTKNEFDSIGDSRSQHGFNNVIEKSLNYFLLKTELTYLGIKETMCEEFLPYLCETGYKCIVIIRDPRDVLASANYPRGTKHFGKKRPSLFILRSWRKSVEYVYSLQKHNNFLFLRYEDLVINPYFELNKITEFLGLDNFPEDYFENGIFDRNGKIWQANSSFRTKGSFISRESKGIYKKMLSTEEIDYAEAICKYEMDWLNYPRELGIVTARSIENFKDTGIEYNQYLPANYSSQSENILEELKRIKIFSHFYFQDD